MSYLVLARKSRPQTFDEVIGQQAIVKTLQNSIIQKRVAHAILFSGVRGVGKTTLARIIAKSLNCEKGPALNPCGHCISCKEIQAGSSIDVYEIDGASNNGIDEIRELKEKIKFLPNASRHKIIIIDEVHMLSTQAFNGLLKTLEEPPAHVYFIFATTETHKIPTTIMSRCQCFDLKKISNSEIKPYLFKLAVNEGVNIESEALDIIVHESEGSIRDALSLLDQAISFSGKNITENDIVEIFGLIDKQTMLQTVNALLTNNTGEALTLLDKCVNFGIDLKKFTVELLKLFRYVILYKIQGCEKLIDITNDDLSILRVIAEQSSLETLHMKLNIMMQGVEDLQHSTQPRLVVESTFIKIAQTQHIVAITDILSNLNNLTDKNHTNVNIKKKSNLHQPTSKTPTASNPTPLKNSETSPKYTAANKNIPQTSPHQKDVRKSWIHFIEYVRDRKIWMAQDLNRANSISVEKDILKIKYTDEANCALLKNNTNIKLLTEFALDFFQQELKIQITSPNQLKKISSENDTTPQKQRQSLANDNLVLAAVDIFNGSVGDIRIGPRFRK